MGRSQKSGCTLNMIMFQSIAIHANYRVILRRNILFIHLQLYPKEEETDDTKENTQKDMQGTKGNVEEQRRGDKGITLQEKEEGFKEPKRRGNNRKDNHY